MTNSTTNTLWIYVWDGIELLSFDVSKWNHTFVSFKHDIPLLIDWITSIYGYHIVGWELSR